MTFGDLLVGVEYIRNGYPHKTYTVKEFRNSKTMYTTSTEKVVVFTENVKDVPTRSVKYSKEFFNSYLAKDFKAKHSYDSIKEEENYEIY